MFTFSLHAQDLPYVGETYTINYNPSEKGILDSSNSIEIVYTFNSWSNQRVYPNNKKKLFQKIIQPDSGLAFRKELNKQGNIWTVEIEIPIQAALLSYYLTDGEKNDFFRPRSNRREQDSCCRYPWN